MTDTIVEIDISGPFVGSGPNNLGSYTGKLFIDYTELQKLDYTDYNGTTVTGSIQISTTTGDATYSQFYIVGSSPSGQFSLYSGTATQQLSPTGNFSIWWDGELPSQAIDISAFVINGNTSSQYFASDQSVSSSLLSGDIACFVSGTLIYTPNGKLKIEDLCVGDQLITHRGQLRTVRWLGRRYIDIRRHPMAKKVLPIKVRTGAFGDGQPNRDLWLSPNHNVAFDDVLIPISSLINGRSVLQVDVEQVEYWHVELDTHDVILAEGLPAESYLDTGNRTSFSNGGLFVKAHPDFEPRHWAETCLPLAFEGPEVVAAKKRLLERLSEQGEGVTSDADVHVLVDGLRVEPIYLSDTRLAFTLPPGGRDLLLRSRTFVPAHTVPESDDPRSLGLCVGALEIDGTVVSLDQQDVALAGWYEAEFVGARFSHRWTTGATLLPSGAQIVILELVGTGYYWSVSKDLLAAHG